MRFRGGELEVGSANLMTVPLQIESWVLDVSLEHRTGVLVDSHIGVEEVLLLLSVVNDFSLPFFVRSLLAPVVVPHVDEVAVDGISKHRVEVLVRLLVKVRRNLEIHVVGALVPVLRREAVQLIQTGVRILLRDNFLLRQRR